MARNVGARSCGQDGGLVTVERGGVEGVGVPVVLARSAGAARHGEVVTVAAEPEGAGLHLAGDAGGGALVLGLALVDLALDASQGGGVARVPGALGVGEQCRVVSVQFLVERGVGVAVAVVEVVPLDGQAGRGRGVLGDDLQYGDTVAQSAVQGLDGRRELGSASPARSRPSPA